MRAADRLATLAFAVAAALTAWTAGPADADAAASSWSENEQGRLRLVSASEGVGAEPALRLGLEFELVDGWKIYWRSSGDAGRATRAATASSHSLSREGSIS